MCVGRAGDGEKERERDQEDINHAHADPKAVGVSSLVLREAMEKWIDQALMREGEALDIARAWRTNAAPGSASSALWSK